MSEKQIWFKGKMIPWSQATVHVMSHALHYGSSVFEGIRSYPTPNGPAIFRLGPHIRRLWDSCKIYRMEIPFSPAEITQACKDVIKVNGYTNSYLRPLVWRGEGPLGLDGKNNPIEAMVAAVEWGAYLGPEGLKNGVDVMVSSWNRLAANTIPTMAKAGGNYLSSFLIKSEAARNGYAEGIALDVQGNVAEGSGMNLFVVRDGVLYTPPITNNILPGITRDAIMTIARDLKIEVREQEMQREVLYLADELFFAGTAAEVTPIRSVDKIVIGSGQRGELTEAIQERFFGLFEGKVDDKHKWLDYV
ncbi:MAG: branched-chain amino acid transaminase [Roseiflexaceae bacterium]|jgi:branched-chain amino acid aminotransferase|nr:branched-chain amino acid transaminase [Chloroflexaceae bacterium]